MPSIAQLINGVRYDFSSIELTINGLTYSAVQEISYTHELQPGILRGTRPGKLGRTRGQYDANGSLVMYKSDYQQFITLLQATNPLTGYMEKNFLVTVIYEEIGSGELITDVLQGCRIVSEENSHSEGSDALQVTAQLDIMQVIPNGMTPIAPTALLP